MSRAGHRVSQSFGSPLGPLTLEADGGQLAALRFGADSDLASGYAAVLEDAARQLSEYFAGRRKRFELPFAPEGTSFQRGVWAVLERIPYGMTKSYGEVATELGKPRAVRAVGQAAGRNPLPIFIPCHRVVAAGGRIGGYAGGLERKRWLLAREART